MYIDEENPEKLKDIGCYIKAAKLLRKEIIDFFVKDEAPVYGSVEETQFMIDIINSYIRGEDPEYIGDLYQTESDNIRKLLGLMELEVNER